MRKLEVGMPVKVNGHNAEILEFWTEPDTNEYISVKVEYEKGGEKWVPVKKLEFVNESVEITAIRPRELFHQKQHAGRIFPRGSGGRIIDKSHPAKGSDVIVIGASVTEPIRAIPRTRYTVEVTDGPHSGQIYDIVGDKEKLWLEEPSKLEVTRKQEVLFEKHTAPVKKEYVEIPEGLPLSEVSEEQLPLFNHSEYEETSLPDRELEAAKFEEPAIVTGITYVELDLPYSYARILNELYTEEGIKFITPKQLGVRLGIKTSTAKNYMDTIKKRMRDIGMLEETEFKDEVSEYSKDILEIPSEEEINEEDIPEDAYLEFWGIEDEKGKD